MWKVLMCTKNDKVVSSAFLSLQLFSLSKETFKKPRTKKKATKENLLQLGLRSSNNYMWRQIMSSIREKKHEFTYISLPDQACYGSLDSVSPH